MNQLVRGQNLPSERRKRKVKMWEGMEGVGRGKGWGLGLES